MFGLIRIIIGLIIFVCIVSIVKTKKIKLKHKRKISIISFVFTIIIVILLNFIPFENIFVTFHSHEAVYKYFNFVSDIKLVVQGQNCDLVVGGEDRSYVYQIVPKTTDGWKVGTGFNSKNIAQKLVNGIVVDIYQYKNTSDYFVRLYDSHGGTSEVSDSCNSKFFSLESYHETIDETFVFYYAYVFNISRDYKIKVNGEELILFNE